MTRRLQRKSSPVFDQAHETPETGQKRTPLGKDEKKHLDHKKIQGEKGQWGKIGEGPSRNIYKGHMDKAKGGAFEGGRWRWVEQGGVVG